MTFSVYIVRPSVLSLSNLKLRKTHTSGQKYFYLEKLTLWLTFNPGLALTGFQTTRPLWIVLSSLKLPGLQIALFSYSANFKGSQECSFYWHYLKQLDNALYNNTDTLTVIVLTR